MRKKKTIVKGLFPLVDFTKGEKYKFLITGKGFKNGNIKPKVSLLIDENFPDALKFEKFEKIENERMVAVFTATENITMNAELSAKTKDNEPETTTGSSEIEVTVEQNGESDSNTYP